MSLKEQIQNDMKSAMRDGQTDKRDALRMLMAAIKQTEVDSGKALDDTGITDLLFKQVKLRRESIADYERGGRTEQAAKEQAEVVIIEQYLPKMMSREEVTALVAAAIQQLNITNAKEIGKLMSHLMPHVKGKADGRMVNEVVKELLAS
ncbi:MAG: GatB/YqeY domain-containing protein [Chloroflexi bacterium]|nr:GatB/YqeY domain-containing protein [Chloroflexota bacterium]MBP8056095.1 GatB/YqeY domain-containing protein [Chloroflexota bacterium]